MLHVAKKMYYVSKLVKITDKSQIVVASIIAQIFLTVLWFYKYTTFKTRPKATHRCTNARHSSTLCLQAKGVMLDFWNEAIENQLTLLHKALKCKTVKLAYVLFSLVWIYGGAQQTRWNEWVPVYKRGRKNDRERLYLFKWLDSNELGVQKRKCVQFKRPEAEREK